MVAHYEGGKDELTIWSSTQNPHILRTFVARMIGLGQDRVRAIAPEVGGGFGAKINIYGEEYVAAALSKRLDMPLKWIEDRSEAFLATVHGRDLIGYVDLAARRDGSVLGLKLRIVADIGAYNMLLTAGIPTNSMTMAGGNYAFPAVRVTLTEVFTNKTPTDAYRGAGRPEATCFVERAMDMLAREIDMDPAELRRKNFIRPDRFPYRTPLGAVYDSGDYEKTLDRALETAGWAQLRTERAAARAAGRVVGLGLSMYVESCGLGPSAMVSPGGWEHSQVTVERDGRISATTGASPHGQGNETTFAQMLADQFGVPIDHVTIRHGDTAVVKQGIGTFGSRSQAVGGTALHNAGIKVKAKMARFAAFLLEAHEEDLVFENGTIAVQGAPSSARPFAEVAAYAYKPVKRPEDLDPGLSDEAFFEPLNNTYPFGCQIAMIEVDRGTGEARLLKMVAVKRCRPPHQSAHRRGADPRRARAGHRPGAHRGGRLRPRRPAAHRVVHGLRPPPRRRLPAFRARPHRHPDPRQPAGREGSRRGGDHRLDPLHRRRRRRRAEPVRRAAHRHDAAAREALAPHAGGTVVNPAVSTCVEGTSRRATSGDRRRCWWRRACAAAGRCRDAGAATRCRRRAGSDRGRRRRSTRAPFSASTSISVFLARRAAPCIAVRPRRSAALRSMSMPTSRVTSSSDWSSVACRASFRTTPTAAMSGVVPSSAGIPGSPPAAAMACRMSGSGTRAAAASQRGVAPT